MWEAADVHVPESMSVCVCVFVCVRVCLDEHGCIMSDQPLFNINNPFWVSPLPLFPPPTPPSSSSTLHLSSSIWPVFKRLRAPMKLDWVQCNEEHARESYDIKCHTNTPMHTHIHSHQTHKELHNNTDRTHGSFGRMTKTCLCVHCVSQMKIRWLYERGCTPKYSLH